MHINVDDILADPVGTTAVFTIAHEQLSAPDITIVKPLSGQLTLVHQEEALGVYGPLELAVELQCHRCLQGYTQPLQCQLHAEFALKPDEDQWPIQVADHEQVIVLDPIIRDEILVQVPLQQVCRPDCPGLCAVCGEVQTAPHDHPDEAEARAQLIIKKD